ncbi:MAG: hypothetical protein N3B14_09280 [Thermoleophilia bacterium]|nr:hypothetical protein [Thermoleophilia bacterium]
MSVEYDPTDMTAQAATTSKTAQVATPETTAANEKTLDVDSVSTTTPSVARQTLASLSLQQEAAQVLLATFSGTSLDPYLARLLGAGPPGGLLLLEANITDLQQLKTLIGDAQAVAGHTTGVGLLIAVDQEGGPVARIREGVPSLPAARVVGANYSVLEAARLAEETAKALCSLGINVNLAPVADVVSNPESFLYLRTYSGDPTVVARFVRAVTEGYRKGGLVTVAKHFPGHGAASEDTHKQTVISHTSQAEFATTHFPPFLAAMEAGTEGIMVAHIVAEAYDPERPASLSPVVVNTVLRTGLGFAGLVVADDLEMAGAAWRTRAGQERSGRASSDSINPAETAVAALLAGCDLLISTGTLDRQLQIIDGIVEAVENGDLPRERLDEAALRVLQLKARCGLLGR